jgi:hypothetical protein
MTGPVGNGNTPIKLVYKCGTIANVWPEVHPCASDEKHVPCHISHVPASKSPCMYTSTSSSMFGLDFFYHDNASQINDLSVDSSSVCESPETLSLSETINCDDPLSELMRLDLSDIDNSSLFADILVDDDLLNDWSVDLMCKPTSHKYQADNGISKAVNGVEKKRSSNRQAALRYRERKRLQKRGFDGLLHTVKREHERLRSELFAEYQSATLLIDLAKTMC